MASRKSKEDSHSIGEDDEEYEEEITNLTELPEDVPNKIEQIMRDSMKLKKEMIDLLDQMHRLKTGFVTQDNFQELEEHFSQLSALMELAHPVQAVLRSYRVFTGQMAEAKLYTTYVVEDLLNRTESLTAFLTKAIFSARDNLLDATTIHVGSLIKQVRNRDTNPEVVQALELATLKAEDEVDQEIMEFFELAKTLHHIKTRKRFYVRRLVKTMLDYDRTQRKIINKLLKAVETAMASYRPAATAHDKKSKSHDFLSQ
ncbi:hypothetical protein TTRE_0000130901 [Trichuris trichiura]|uniref:Uncharacterized protein n=1 Tax=Trichuris trichiura TaxID=36087 RepID=A0A077YYX7_TRITR|nr:hypothetical protein TTRE_0000130901 [Trichuris trichiura]